MSSDCSAKSRKDKRSFEPPQKRLKSEKKILDTSLLENEQNLPIINDDEAKTLRRSMRVQKQSPDTIINVLNTEKSNLKFGVQNSKSEVMLMNCTKTFISENIVKKLDDLFFSEEREEQNILDLAKLSNDSILKSKDSQQAKESVDEINADSKEKNNDQVKKESEPDQNFEIHKTLPLNIFLKEEYRKEDSNGEKNSSNYEKNPNFGNETIYNKYEAKNENNLKDTSKMEMCDGNCTIKDDYESECKNNMKEQIECKLLMAIEKQDYCENLNNDKICRDTEENIQTQVLELVSANANDVSKFPLSKTPILIDQLYDGKNVDAIIIPLSTYKNLQNNEDHEDLRYSNTFEEKNLNLSNGNEIENDDKQVVKEILNEVDGQEEKLNVHLVNELEEQKNIKTKQMSFHDMKSKSKETLLQTRSFNMKNLNAGKNEQMNTEADEKTYFHETNVIFKKDKPETTQVSRQNTIISNSTLMSSEKSQQENKDFNFSKIENKTDEIKEKKLTLFYTSALDFAKDYHVKDEVDQIKKDSKETNNFNTNKHLKNSENDLSQENFPIIKHGLIKDLERNTVQKSINDSLTVDNKDLKEKKISVEINFSENYKDNSEVREDNKSNLEHDSHELEKGGEIKYNNAYCKDKYDLNDDIITLNTNDEVQQASKFPHKEKELSLSHISIKNFNCDHNTETLTENNGLEEKQKNKDPECCKSKCHNLEKRSFLITATDYFKTEIIKETEIFKEREKCKTNENVNKTDENSTIMIENERNSYSDPDDSFAMDDDFALTASQLSMIETDERNHFKESQERKMDSIQQTESCPNTHFNQDSLTAEIIDQLFYIRESIESIKESLSTLLKSKDAAV